MYMCVVYVCYVCCVCVRTCVRACVRVCMRLCLCDMYSTVIQHMPCCYIINVDIQIV